MYDQIDILHKYLTMNILKTYNVAMANDIGKSMTNGMFYSKNKLKKLLYNSSWSIDLNNKIKQISYWILVVSQFNTINMIETKGNSYFAQQNMTNDSKLYEEVYNYAYLYEEF